MKTCLFTNDVETTSILNHRLSDNVSEYLLNEGMPRLLDLYDKYNVRATFFYTGHIARLAPRLVMMAFERGHEIGSHGLTHEVAKAIDLLEPREQLYHLKESKKILEDIIGEEVISFRAPAARVNKDIVGALLEAGYKIDSSVSSQRLDMFMSFGIRNKLNWITAPRKAYFAANDNIFKRGDGALLEIPISAFIFPYIGTFMRISPPLNRATRTLLYLETLLTNRQFNFLTHPNEFINEACELESIQRRSKNMISYLLGDVLRHKLKVRNLGKEALPILERELCFFQKKDFNFITCKDLYNLKLKHYAGK